MAIKKLLINASSAMALILAGNTHAAVLDFDDIDIPGRITGVQSPYGGFNITVGIPGGEAVTGNATFLSNTTKETDVIKKRGAKSGNNILFNFREPSTPKASLNMSRANGSAFNFTGGYFANWDLSGSLYQLHYLPFNSTSVQFIGYDQDGREIANSGKKTLGDWAWMEIGFKNIFGLSIITDKSVLLMDDFTFSSADDATEVPIPAAALLFAPALLGFMGLRRKVKASA